MGWGTGNLGGGPGGLNFKIVGGTSEPSAPRENTIWVNTDQKITGYYFYATQPENMAEGEVWFAIGAVSDVAFSATKKNPVMVYPLSAKQKIDGALVDVTAMSYQGGSWVAWWNGELFKDGNQFVAVTGGWEPMGFDINGSWDPVAPNLEIGETMKLSLTQTAHSTNSGVAITKKKISLKKWTTLCVFTPLLKTATSGDYNSGISVYVLTSNDNTKYLNDVMVASQVIYSTSSAITQTDITTNLDISGLDDEYYIAIRIALGNKKTGAAVVAEIANILLLNDGNLLAADYQAELEEAYKEGVNSI